MLPIFNIKRHDLQPYFRFSIPDASDLTGASIVCTMVDTTTGTKKINRSAAGCEITNAAEKEAQYIWQTNDTDTSGTYRLEFEITPQVGGKFTVPTDNVQYIVISDDEDGV